MHFLYADVCIIENYNNIMYFLVLVLEGEG